MDDKSAEVQAAVAENGELYSNYGTSLSEEKRGTDSDQLDMFRMGKTQEMRVRLEDHRVCCIALT